MPSKRPSTESNSLSGLHIQWEKNDAVRANVYKKEAVLEWSSTKTTGVPSMENLSLNAKLIFEAAKIWVPQRPEPKTLIVDDLKYEAWTENNGLDRFGLFCCVL